MALTSIENPLLEKILSFVNDNGYRELMESAAKYNIRIRKDRLYRQPYIDGQTGIAQRHCNLFVSDKRRMPGILQGQIYTYPANRWKSKHRSYLASFVQSDKSDPDEHTITTVENPAAVIAPVEETPFPSHVEKDTWQYYDEQAYDDDGEDDFDSEEDHEDETYSSKRGSYKRKRGSTRKPKKNTGGSKKRGSTRVSNKTPRGRRGRIIEDEEDTTGKPFPCDRRSGNKRGIEATNINSNHTATPPLVNHGSDHMPVLPDKPKKRVTPSPYCDFCLGNATENKKTGQPESLVSCADCGRSGHPTCLQFTENMKKSVLTYRWQCIECKTCTRCGTSENDDRLLFCDDCDRGYHLYCLTPPLSDPPEGEWFCHLCLKEFH